MLRGILELWCLVSYLLPKHNLLGTYILEIGERRMLADSKELYLFIVSILEDFNAPDGEVKVKE